MTTMQMLLNLLVAALYALSAALLTRELFTARAYTTEGRWRRLAPAIMGLVLHGLALLLARSSAQILAFGFYHALSIASFAIVVLLMALVVVRPAENLGVGLLPVAALSVLAGLLGSDANAPPVSGGLQVHVVLSILAYAVLSLSAMQALVVGAQSRLLRRHQPGSFIRALPPLSRMESLLFQLLAVGFALLSAALLSGFIYLQDMFAQHLVHKTVLSLLAWGVFAILLTGRYMRGWRGERAARWTLAGAAFLLLAYFGSKFVLELVLQR